MFSSLLTRMHFCIYLSSSNLFFSAVSNHIHRKEKSGCQGLGRWKWGGNISWGQFHFKRMKKLWRWWWWWHNNINILNANWTENFKKMVKMVNLYYAYFTIKKIKKVFFKCLSCLWGWHLLGSPWTWGKLSHQCGVAPPQAWVMGRGGHLDHDAASVSQDGQREWAPAPAGSSTHSDKVAVGP